MRADGSGKPAQLLAGDAIVEPYSWSPDSSLLVYSQRSADKNLHLWALPVSPPACRIRLRP